MKKYLVLLLVTSSIQSFSQDSFVARIDSILTNEENFVSNPGLTVGVVKDGELIYHDSRGLINLEYEIPFNDSTVFGIASITKQFTSACIAILENQGKLSVNDDIRLFIPEIAFYGDTIRISHLLNHTSGIRNHNVLLDLSGFDYNHRGYTNKMIQQLMFRQKGVNNKPGDKMLYSNTNYVLSALIVERVSNMPIHEFARKELFIPLSMNKTFYNSDLNEVIKNRAYSYYKDGDAFKQPKSLTLCVGAGGVRSTVSDLAIWTQVFLDSSHRFSYISDFITNLSSLNNGEQMQHARGIFVTPYKNHLTLNHSGRGWGMRSQLICVPELNLGVIVFANSEHINAVNISYKILDLWIDESPQIDRKKEVYYHSEEDLANFTGHYQELNSDLKMHILMKNDTLNAQSSYGAEPTPLAANSNTTFYRMDNASVKYTFLSDHDSEADLLVDFGGAIFYFQRIKLASNPNQNNFEYAGTFFSEELDVNYELKDYDKELVLNYPNNQGLILKEGEKDVFGSNRRTKYSFVRDDNNQVISFYVAAEGTVKDIQFKKVK